MKAEIANKESTTDEHEAALAREAAMRKEMEIELEKAR